MIVISGISLYRGSLNRGFGPYTYCNLGRAEIGLSEISSVISKIVISGFYCMWKSNEMSDITTVRHKPEDPCMLIG